MFAASWVLPSVLCGGRIFGRAVLGSIGGLQRDCDVLVLVEGVRWEIAELPDFLCAPLFLLLQHCLLVGHFLQLSAVLLDLFLHLS